MTVKNKQAIKRLIFGLTQTSILLITGSFASLPEDQEKEKQNLEGHKISFSRLFQEDYDQGMSKTLKEFFYNNETLRDDPSKTHR